MKMISFQQKDFDIPNQRPFFVYEMNILEKLASPFNVHEYTLSSYCPNPFFL